MADAQDIAGGAADGNANGIPDVCEADADGDGVIDACEPPVNEDNAEIDPPVNNDEEQNGDTPPDQQNDKVVSPDKEEQQDTPSLPIAGCGAGGAGLIPMMLIGLVGLRRGRLI